MACAFNTEVISFDDCAADSPCAAAAGSIVEIGTIQDDRYVDCQHGENKKEKGERGKFDKG